MTRAVEHVMVQRHHDLHAPPAPWLRGDVGRALEPCPRPAATERGMIDMQPPRGAFDYLLDPIRDQLQSPPPPPERDGGSGPPRIHIEIEITERRPVKRDMGVAGAIISLILLGLPAWGAWADGARS